MKRAAKIPPLSAPEREELLSLLEARFRKHMHRHPGLAWERVLERLDADPDKLRPLHEMESSQGEPDVIGRDGKTGEFIFADCSAESPAGRRSICYDREGLESRKEHRPAGNAIDMAEAMGISLLTEDEYRSLQELGEFDLKTSSWLVAPPDVRKSGGAIFGDRRYGRVFIYHNGVQSYYAGRGFRGSVRV